MDGLVRGLILSEIRQGDLGLEFHSRSIDHSLAHGSTELAKNIVAGVDYEGQVGSATFRAKDEVFALLGDHPVEQRNNYLHEVYVFALSLGVGTCNLVLWLLRDPVFPVGVLEARLLLLLILSIRSKVVYPREFECTN